MSKPESRSRKATILRKRPTIRIQATAKLRSAGESESLASVIRKDSVYTVRATKKHEVLKEICEVAAKQAGLGDAAELLESVLANEARVSTQMGMNWAVPHARLAELRDPVFLLIGRSPKGIAYGADDEPPVHLIFLLIVREDAHNVYLKVLAELAAALRAEGMPERVLRAANLRTLKGALTGSLNRRLVSRALPKVTRNLIRSVLHFADDSNIATLMVNIDAFERPEVLKTVVDDSMILVTARREIPQVLQERAHGIIRLPFEIDSSNNSLRLAVVLAINEGLVHRGERVLAVSGPTGSDDLNLLRIFDTNDFPNMRSAGGAAREIASGVLERVLELASKIADEGREGNPVGTCFVLADEEDLHDLTRQLIINPFKGYNADELNVLDVTLEETVKEFAAIDGAFIISRQGRLLSAGTYLLPGKDGDVDLPSGFGARHRSAAMLTKVVECVAVVVSSSTGTVSVFFEGRLVLALSPGTARRVGNFAG